MRADELLDGRVLVERRNHIGGERFRYDEREWTAPSSQGWASTSSIQIIWRPYTMLTEWGNIKMLDQFDEYWSPRLQTLLNYGTFCRKSLHLALREKLSWKAISCGRVAHNILNHGGGWPLSCISGDHLQKVFLNHTIAKLARGHWLDIVIGKCFSSPSNDDTRHQ